LGRVTTNKRIGVLVRKSKKGKIRTLRKLLRKSWRIAIDFDDSCVDSLSALVSWHNERYSTQYTAEHYREAGNKYSALWGCTHEESMRRLHRFHREFGHVLEELPHCGRVMIRLRRCGCELHMLTYRSQELEEVTLVTVDRLFQGVFNRVDLFGHPLKGEIKLVNKAEVCIERDIPVIVEDSPSNALQCAKSGIMVLLIDPEGRYDELSFHGNIIPVTEGWPEIERIVLGTWHGEKRFLPSSL
jgi:hypothetical protein